MITRSIALAMATLLSLGVAGAGDESDPKDGMKTGLLNKTITVHDEEDRFSVYVPEDYTPEKAWPLIVFLHGAGERGDDGTAQTEVGVGPAIQENPERFPAIVLMPQCPEGTTWRTRHDHLEAQVAWARETYTIDDQRIYLTGLSMGGYATWLWGALHTDTFAALLPVCGGGDPDALDEKLGTRGGNPYGSLPSRLRALATVPIWAFHGGADEAVPPEESRAMVEALKARDGNIRYTEYEGVGHNAWDRTYQDPDVIAWLFEQRKD